MNKIVELLIDWDNEEFDDLGVEILSLVDRPAIQVGWQAFSDDSEDLNEYQREILKLCRQESFGQIYDPEKTIVLDLNKEKFVDVQDALEGIAALDSLGDSDPSTQGEIKYRYSGRIRSNTRLFCASMIGLNKLYTADEIVAMGVAAERISGSLYPGTTSKNNDGTVSGGIGEWMGGPNCGHYWGMFEVFPNGVVNDLGRAPNPMGRTMRSLTNNGYQRARQFAFSDDDQMIITGPAMIPNQYILRKDEDGNPFHVFFSEETIQKIAQKFFANSNHNNTDINHNGEVVQENTLLESWIVEDPELDKSKALGFDVPAKTWMVSMKVNDKETWNKIKNGDLSGYSVEGSFIEKLVK